jgi:hypothetical protein
MAIIAIYDRGDRAFACRLIERAAPGSRFELLPPKSTDPQERRMWALLADISKQYQHAGRYHDQEVWRSLMLQVFGQEVDWIPSLGGEAVIPFGGSHKKMGVSEMAEFLSFIEAWGVQNGVVFRDQSSR